MLNGTLRVTHSSSLRIREIRVIVKVRYGGEEEYCLLACARVAWVAVMIESSEETLESCLWHMHLGEGHTNAKASEFHCRKCSAPP